MNKVILMGRLTKNPEVRYSSGEKPIAVARYTLAVTRIYKKTGEPDADFINCVTFGHNAEFAEKYFTQGIRIIVCGRIQTGNYTKQDGSKVFTTDVIVETQEFTESKKELPVIPGETPAPEGDGFMNVPDNLDSALPFSEGEKT